MNMPAAILLAHLIGDYILQWDDLARWKSREFRGVLVHGTIVWLATWALSALFDPGWWPWALLIGVTHTAFDALTPWFRKLVSPLVRLLLDQAVHLCVIVAALAASGYLAPSSVLGGLAAAARDHHLLALALGYAFITMPAWVLVEFAAFGLVKGSAPDFEHSTNKYVGILERALITTCVVLGQFALVPVVALPRLVLEGPQVMSSRRVRVYVAEWLGSVGLAVAVGLGLRGL